MFKKLTLFFVFLPLIPAAFFLLSGCNKIICDHHEHIVVDYGYAPTCLIDGKTDGQHCSKCGFVLAQQKTIPALGHDLVTYPAINPTCIKDGKDEKIVCKRCGEVIHEDVILPARGHNIVTIPGIEPTENSTGLTDGKYCSNCGEIFEHQKVLPKTIISITNENEFLFDENGNGYIEYSDKRIVYSKSSVSEDGHLRLENQGIITNYTPFKKISKITIEAIGDVDNLFLYNGKTRLSYDSVRRITNSCTVEFEHGECSFLVLYNGKSDGYVDIISLVIYYQYGCNDDESLPIINIKTNKDELGNYEIIEDRINYVESVFSLIDNQNPQNNIYEADVGIRVRGNTTAYLPKKPYRLKFNDKQSFFGLTAAKNWVLLAEYFDYSSMFNFAAFRFAKYVDGFRFVPNAKHVNVYINGDYVGMYTFCEHIDKTEGRLNIEQRISSDTKLSDINFYVEISNSIKSWEVENRDWFWLDGETPYKRYSLKYPKIDDFPDYNKNSDSSAMFDQFLIYIKNYLENLWFFIENEKHEDFLNVIDEDSLVSFAIVDAFLEERDHRWKSFKHFYNKETGIQFGPVWDYDLCAFKRGLDLSQESFDLSISNAILYQADNVSQLRTKFRTKFKKVLIDSYSFFIDDLKEELDIISQSLIENCIKWYNGDLFSIFDYTSHLFEFLNLKSDYLLKNELLNY